MREAKPKTLYWLCVAWQFRDDEDVDVSFDKARGEGVTKIVRT
jgi:hypothetical protein